MNYHQGGLLISGKVSAVNVCMYMYMTSPINVGGESMTPLSEVVWNL